MYPIPYSHFAEIYDLVMKKVPYQKWANLLINVFKEFQLEEKHSFLEIASGTGDLSQLMTEFTPNLFGIDLSLAMLKKARCKVNYPLAQANMKSLPFTDNSFNGIYCTHDSINYLSTKKEVLEHFREVKRVIKPKGIYIFDISTEKNIIKNYHNKSFTKKYNNIQFFWNNNYNLFKKQLVSILKFEKVTKGFLFNKKTLNKEIHIQTIYSKDEIREALLRTDFHFVRNYADYDNFKSIRDSDIMVYVVSA